MRKLIPFMLALAALFAAAGCPGKSGAKPPARDTRPAAPDTALDMNPEQAAREVLGGVPLQGRLREVKERGSLRFGLPPAREPFQSVHPDLGRPAGFNVALAEQMAKTMNLEAVVEFVPGTNREADRWSKDFDIVFQEPGMALCGGRNEIPYFMHSGSREWLTMCVAGQDPALDQAVRNTLDWFVETGMYTYLYTEYFP